MKDWKIHSISEDIQEVWKLAYNSDLYPRYKFSTQNQEFPLPSLDDLRSTRMRSTIRPALPGIIPTVNGVTQSPGIARKTTPQ